MNDKAIILDLDHTIFPTESMDSEIFAPFFKDLITRLNPIYDETVILKIVNDLWLIPFDQVTERYKIPKNILTCSFKILENISLKLSIAPYADYNYIKCFKISKFLVTTGFQSLQLAKIKSLGIEEDFLEVKINDPIKENKTKRDLFSELITKYNLIPEKTFVIGDNPDSEIKAGNDLNMITIQILRENVKKGNNANYYINSFSELEKILDLD